MSSTKIDVSQIDLPGTSADLLSGDGEVAINIGANLTFAGAVLSGPSTLLQNVLFVTTTGNDGTADGSINLPFASLQGAHDYAEAHFRPETHVVIAIASGVYEGKLSVSRSRTHFSAIGTITDSDRTVLLDGAQVVINCRVPGPAAEEPISFEGIYMLSRKDTENPVVTITGNGLFASIFNACTLESPSSQTGAYTLYSDNIPEAGRSTVEVRDSIILTSNTSVDTTTVMAKRSAWSFLDSQVINLSTKTAGAVSGTNDSVLAFNSSTVRNYGTAQTIFVEGDVVSPDVVLTLEDTTVESLSEGDTVSDCSAIIIGRGQYAVVKRCAINVVDGKASYAINGGKPSTLNIGGEQFAVGSNRKIGEFVEVSRLDSWTGQYVFVDTDYTALQSDYVINCVGDFKVTLPQTNFFVGRMYVVKNSGGGTIIVQSAGSETFDGNPSVVLGTYDVVRVMSTGTSWIIL